MQWRPAGGLCCCAAGSTEHVNLESVIRSNYSNFDPSMLTRLTNFFHDSQCVATTAQVGSSRASE